LGKEGALSRIHLVPEGPVFRIEQVGAVILPGVSQRTRLTLAGGLKTPQSSDMLMRVG